MHNKSSSSRRTPNKKQTLIRGPCNAALCCSSCSRLSVSSSEDPQSSGGGSSGRFPAISSLSHAMVQERLEQMIREREEVSRRVQRRHGSSSSGGNSKLIVMVAMEKCSYDPLEDFRESIRQMIVANRIWEPKDLRRLLNCYVSMNSEESREVILEAFHDVCSTLFLSCPFSHHNPKPKSSGRKHTEPEREEEEMEEVEAQRPEILSPCSSGRRSGDSTSPEFEFWMVRNPSFPQPNLLSADELFSDGVLLPLDLLPQEGNACSDESPGEILGLGGENQPETSGSARPGPGSAVVVGGAAVIGGERRRAAAARGDGIRVDSPESE
nr:probable transcription repressor OFP9 [Ipomoea batatas]